VLQALLQAGLIGAIPFVAAMIFGWVSFFRIVRKLALIPGEHKHLVIQCGGVLAFLTIRSLPESTGAFFGVDWLILAPVLFYLHVVNNKQQPLKEDSSHRVLER
jgi:O-antigen ligase